MSSVFDGMTPELHARILGDLAKQSTIQKYMKGAAEHGGYLWQVPISKIIDFAIEEADDEGVYLRTIQQLDKEVNNYLRDLFAELEMLEEPLAPNAQELVRRISDLRGL